MAKENKVISADDFASDIPVETENNAPVEETQPTEKPDFVAAESGEEPPVEEPKQEEVHRVKRTGSETEIREVDPTKNAKLQKRMKQKPSSEYRSGPSLIR